MQIFGNTHDAYTQGYRFDTEHDSEKAAWAAANAVAMFTGDSVVLVGPGGYLAGPWQVWRAHSRDWSAE